AIALSRRMQADEVIVVSETEYTGAGKSPVSQLAFAETNGVDVAVGPREEDIPGKTIRLPARIEDIETRSFDLNRVRKSYLKKIDQSRPLESDDYAFLAEDVNLPVEEVKRRLR